MKKDAKNPVVKAKVVKSLDELQGLIDAPMKCQFKIDGVVLEIAVKRKTPAIAERERAIERKVQPPFKKERNDYDPLDPDYLKKRDEARDKARCVVVYFCCPIVAAKKACATDEEIYAFVSTTLTPNLQELIALTAQAGGMQMSDAANFISPAASES